MQREMTEVEKAAAMFGLKPEWAAEPAEQIYLWPENVKIWNLFSSLGTQWKRDMDGAYGLDYPGVEVVMRIWRIKRKHEQDVFRKIQLMEQATLEAWGERRNG